MMRVAASEQVLEKARQVVLGVRRYCVRFPGSSAGVRVEEVCAPSCCWEPLGGSHGLPDPDDEHVVAAVVGGAGVIVTHNFKCFPEGLVPKHIKVVSTDECATDAVAVSPMVARQAIEAMAKRLGNPPMSVEEVLALLVDRYGMGDTVALLREV